MIEVRPFAELGRFDNEWLNARHHFSFGSYHDPARDGLGPLLVWNDDTVAPGRGFDLHPAGQLLAVAHADKTLRLYDMSPKAEEKG